MKRLVIASHNPVKIRALRSGFSRVFSETGFSIDCAGVDSGVSDQPMTSAETLQGATNRAVAARESAPDADLWVGIEGGVEDSPEGMAAFAWIVAFSAGRVGRGRTATFFLPEQIAGLVRNGMELGAADDRVFGRENSKQANGAIGLLTDDALDRAGLYEQGVIMALLPFRNADLYPVTDACGMARNQSPG